MGFVQFGELVDSSAEFVLDVADAVVGWAVSSGLEPIRGLLILGFAYKSAGLPGLMLVICVVRTMGFLRIRDARVGVAMTATVT